MQDPDHRPFQKVLNVNQDPFGRPVPRREEYSGFSSVCAFSLDVVDFPMLVASFYLQRYIHIVFYHLRRFHIHKINADF